MIQLVFLAWLIVAQAQTSHVQTIYGVEGERIYLSVGLKKAQKCIVITNQGESYDFSNLTYQTATDIMVANKDQCSLYLKLTSKDLQGLWKINATYIEKGPDDVTSRLALFDVNIKNVIKEERIYPSRQVTVADGNYVLAHLENVYQNLTSCTLVNQENEVYNSISDELDIASKNNQCVVRMKVKPSYSGKWKLYANLGTMESRVGTFEITVVNRANQTVMTDNVYAKKGSKYYQLMFAQSVIYCEIQNPEGNLVRKQQGACFYDIPLVTSYHNGTWMASYYTKGQSIKLYSKINLHVYDSPSVNASVTFGDNGEINLLCKFHEDVRITVCRFEDPNNNVIVVNPGVGDDRYEYFGNGFGFWESYSQECGITIRRPDERDFGIWKCLVDVKDKSSHEGSILHVQREPDNSPKVATADKIYVSRGNSFQIKCKTQSALKYCSIKSPNGTMYSMTTSKKLLSGSVAYEGAGLALGECGANLPGANYSDNGVWSCQMGLRMGLELEARVPVIVTESSIIASEDKMELNSADVPITLSCVPIPGSEFDIDYCRWIKPDGTTLQYKTDIRYSIQTNNRYCKLVIKDNAYENVGRWTCIAGISYETTSEALAHIEVYYKSSVTYWITLGASVSIVVLMIILFILYRNNLRQRMSDSSIDFKYLI